MNTCNNILNNGKQLKYPIKYILENDYLRLELEEGSYLEIQNHKRDLEKNILLNYNLETKSPVFFFNGIWTPTPNQGVGTYLMNICQLILDRNSWSVLNEVRPQNKKDLNKLIEFYERFGFTLLEKGKYCALMFRSAK